MEPPQENQLLVVLTVLAGRNIPAIQNTNFVVDAKLANEQLSTDPVTHNNPTTGFEINSELAWQMTKKTLHGHKLKRTPLKLTIFSHNLKTKSRPQTGHIILDLRSLPYPETLTELKNIKNLETLQPKWYPILNSKYKIKSLQPELLIQLTLESDEITAANEKYNKEQKDEKMKNFPTLNKNYKIDKGWASTKNIDKNQYIQIGNSEKPHQEMFILSIMTKGIENILDLIRANAHIQLQPKAKLYVYTSIFNKDIKFQEFDIADNRPDSVTEEAKIKIRANVHELHKTLTNHSSLAIHLCCGDRSLGSATLSVNNLVKQSVFSNNYPIIPPIKAISMNKTNDNLKCKIFTKIELNYITDEGIQRVDQKLEKLNFSQKKKEEPISKPIIIKESISKATKDISPRIESPLIESPKDVETQSQPNIKQEIIKLTKPVPPIEKACRYTFITNLIGLKNFYSPFTGDLHVRFMYSYFGEKSNSTKNYKVSQGKLQSINLNSISKTHFAAPHTQLIQTFKSEPLELQIWSENILIGRAISKIKFSNTPTIIGEDYPPGGSDTKVGFHSFTTSVNLSIIAATGSSQIGELELQFILINFDPNEVVPKIDKNGQLVNDFDENDNSMVDVNLINEPHNLKSNDPRKSQEYKIALELEIWKENEKKNFTKILQDEKESEINFLTKEFKRREVERETGYRKKLAEYQWLEKQMKNGVYEMEKKEIIVNNQKRELNELKTSLLNDKERFVLDHKSAIDRLKKEHASDLNLEKKKVLNLENEVVEMKETIRDKNLEISKLNKTISKLHEEYNKKPDIKATQELKIKSNELINLSKLLETANKSKNYYKQQWTVSLSEFAKIKQKNMETEKNTLSKQNDQIELLKKKILLNEETSKILQQRKLLGHLSTAVRNDINDFGVNRNDNIPMDQLHGTNKVVDPINEHAARLLTEREALISTGAYNTTDLIIQQLDERIKQAL